VNPIVKRLIQIGLLVLIQAMALFGAAWRLNWVEGWVYIGLYLAFIALNAVLMLSKPGSVELIKERSQIKENAKGWDKAIGLLIGLFGSGMLIVAGFDERWSWSPHLAVAVQVAAFVVVALGDVLFAWAMASNKFFSSVVRIQQDRGHTVQTGGPYRFVRHPGYLGAIVPALATPLALGSLWAFIPAGLLTAVMVVRTALEDKTLRGELAGYEEYAQRTRYRLVPGMW
jgi:protein-S-isoprenylcysteine O-methyltransferase Ste14